VRARFWIVACVLLAALLGAAPAQAAWSSQTSKLSAVIIGTTSCPTASDCVQENNVGKFQYTSDGGATWTASTADLTDSTWGMDCPATSLCFATGDNGNIYRSTDRGVSWSTVSTGTPALYGIACPSTSICYAVSGDGRIRKTTDGGTTWVLGTTQATVGLFSVSCPSTTVCYADGAAGGVYKKQSGSDTWDQVATSASMPDILSPYTHSLSCPSLTVCYAGGTDGTISKTTDGGANWTQQTTAAAPDTYALSCVSVTRCLSVGVAHKSQFTDDGGATWTVEDTGSAAAMYSLTWADGKTAHSGDAIGVPYQYIGPGIPSGSTTESATLTAGMLSVTPPSTITFPSTVLNNTDQVKSVAAAFTVTDATGSGDGWALNATSTTFTSGGHTLPSNATKVLALPGAACAASTTCSLGTNAVSFPFIMPAGSTAPAAAKLYNAAADTGLGAQVITPTWSLAVPATTFAGTYTSTWTFTLTAGP
jgi:photosystem II stability/assembly factor-like uncharacterized protein